MRFYMQNVNFYYLVSMPMNSSQFLTAAIKKIAF